MRESLSRKKITLAFTLLFISIIAFFHGAFVATSLRWFLGVKELSFERMSVSSKGITLHHLAMGAPFDVEIEETTFKIGLAWHPFHLKRQLELDRPHFHPKENEFSIEKWLNTRLQGVDLTIKEGVLTVGEFKAFFSYSSATPDSSYAFKETAHLTLSSDPLEADTSRIRIELFPSQNFRCATLQFDKAQCVWLWQLMKSLVGIDLPKVHIQKGEMAGQLAFSFGENLIDLSGTLSLQHLNVRDERGLQFEVEKLNWQGRYQPEENEGTIQAWQRGLGHFEMSKVALALEAPLTKQPWLFTQIEGSADFEEGSNPTLGLKALLLRDGISTPVSMTLTGLLNPDFTHSFTSTLFVEKALLASLTGEGRGIKDFTLHLNLPSLSLSLINFFKDFLPASKWDQLDFDSGVLESQLTWNVREGVSKDLVVDHFSLREAQCHYQSDAAVRLAHLRAKGSLNPADPLSESALHFYWEGGETIFKTQPLPPLCCNGNLALLGSQIKGAVALDMGDSKSQLSLKGPLNHPQYTLDVTGNGDSLIALLPEEIKERVRQIERPLYRFTSKGSVSPEEMMARAAFSLLENESERLELELMLSAPMISLQNPRGLATHLKGWFKGIGVGESLYRPILAAFGSDSFRGGHFDIEGVLDPEMSTFQVSLQEMIVQTDSLSLKASSLEPGQFFLTQEENPLTGHLKLKAVDLSLKDPALTFEEFVGELVVEGPTLRLDALKGRFRDAEIEGKMRIEWGQGYEIQIDSIEARADEALAFLRQFELFRGCEWPLLGKVQGDRSCFYLISNLTQSFWELNLKLYDGAYASPSGLFRDFAAQVHYDSQEKHLLISNFNGRLCLADELTYDIDARLVEGYFDQMKRWNFDLRLGGLTHELVRFVGQLRENEGWDLSLNHTLTQCLGEAITLDKGHFSPEFIPEILHLKTTLNLNALYTQIDALFSSGIIPLKEFPLQQLAGKLNLSLVADQNLLDIKGWSEGVEINEQKSPFTFTLHGEGGEYRLEELSYGGAKVSATVLELDKRYHVKQITYRDPHITFLASDGIVDWGLKQLTLPITHFEMIKERYAAKVSGIVEGDFSKDLTAPHVQGLFQFETRVEKGLAFSAKSQLPVKLSYSKESGLLFENLQFEMTEGRGAVEKIKVSREGVLCDGLSLSLSSELFNKWLKENSFETPSFLANDLLRNREITLEGSLNNYKQKLHFEGEMKALEFQWNQLTLQIDHCEVKVDTKSRDLKFELALLFCGVPLHVDVNSRLLKGYPTAICATNDLGERLTLLASYDTVLGLQVDRFYGDFFGIETDLSTSTKLNHPGVLRFSGHMRFNFNRICDLLPASLRTGLDEWQVGRGYELSGELVLFKDRLSHSYFKGFLKGRDFEIKGFSVKTLLSEININSHQIDLSDLCISDQAGLITIRSMRFRQSDAGWQFTIPEIQMQDFRPSLLTDIYGQKGRIRPFLIRELTCEKISGKVGDRKSVTGFGQLTFVNTFKRSQNLLDIPIDIIGRIGLDAAILVPVTGEMTYELGQGRVNFLQLLECFSEGRRSRFTLSKKKPSYLDLNGDFHVDIKMKQYVLLRFTQPFTLSIRGSLESPRFSLK